MNTRSTLRSGGLEASGSPGGGSSSSAGPASAAAAAAGARGGSLQHVRLLTVEQLQRLQEHKYKAEGISVLDVQLQPFWRFVVSLMPMWLAPNLITWVGLLVNISTSLYLVYHNPTMAPTEHEVPTSCFLGCAVGLWVYQTLDNIDGKQARRTGTANSLGELFDHGCDAVSTVVVIVAYLTALQVGASTFGFWVAMTAVGLYYLCHWECYVKGRVHFNHVDVTEAQYLIMLVHLITALLGQQTWSNTIFGIEYSLAMAAATGVFFLRSIIDGGTGPEGSTVAETGILSPMGPFFLMVAGLWFLQGTESYAQYPSLLLLGGGCGTAKLTWKLIVSHMSVSPLGQFDSVHFVPLLYMVLVGLKVPSNPAMIVCVVVWLADFVAYATRVVLDLANFLHVDVFRIKPVVPVPVAPAH